MESSLSVLPDPLSGVEEQLAVDGVGDLTLEGSNRFLLRLALGDLALEVDPALRVRIADLGDRCHVDVVIELAVAPP